jgi:hypothetical protein
MRPLNVFRPYSEDDTIPVSNMRATLLANYSLDIMRNSSVYNPFESYYLSNDYSYYLKNNLLTATEATTSLAFKFCVAYASVSFYNIDI